MDGLGYWCNLELFLSQSKPGAYELVYEDRGYT